MQIKIDVTNKIALAQEDYHIVCNNGDYTILFSFDSEWDTYEVKTAHFSFTRSGSKKHIDVPFSGNECAVPILRGIKSVEIGVYAGNLHTTTPCLLKCERSALCDSGVPEEPPKDVYNQLLELLNNTNGNAHAEIADGVLHVVGGNVTAEIENNVLCVK